MDIQTEIEKAISKGYKELVLPIGEYIVHETIVIPNDFILRFE